MRCNAFHKSLGILILLADIAMANTTVTPLFNGVVRTHNTRTTPRLLNINVIAIDLSARGIRFHVTPGNGDYVSGETTPQTPQGFLEETGAQVAFNCNFFDKITYPSGVFTNLYGLVYSDGVPVSSFASTWPALNISSENVASIISTSTSGYSLFNAVAGSAVIVTNGANTAGTMTDSVSTTLNPRTAAGISADGRYLIVMTVDGRNDSVSLGVTLIELGDLMIEYGAANAVNLDGGGSTQLIIDQGNGAYVANVPSETARTVGTNMAVFAWPIGATSGEEGYEQPVDSDEPLGLQFVKVGNPGNLPDAVTPYGYAKAAYGEVDYTYYIGKYEITCAQYAQFLNAVASTSDPYNLYVSTGPGSAGNVPQIAKTTQPNGSYLYTPNFGWKNRPIGYITWARAARYGNWLTTGDTEKGIYTISSSGTVVVNKGFKVGHTPAYWIPNSNEYYKAAYYNPDTQSYYTLPTSTDAAPTAGEFNNTNSGNWRKDNITAIGEPYLLSQVGSFINARSPYGCYDMLGNVWEWGEDFSAGASGCYGPMYHGASYYSNNYLYCSADYFTSYVPTGTVSVPGVNVANFDMGMRIACNEEAITPTLADNTIKFVEIGDTGNAADDVTSYGYLKDAYGKVDYRYGIGKFEITCAQYAQFLNAVAATGDPYGLYSSTGPDSAPQIARTPQEDGSYFYAVNYGWAQRPVGYTTWAKAARFCNWLTSGDTETGVYVFTNGTFTSINSDLKNNTTQAVYWIPTLNEFYKAAYYDPTSQSYYDYPTFSNAAPVTGNYAGTNTGNWRCNNTQFIGSPYYLTEVGTFINTRSVYGCYDMFGNVWEWTESFAAGASGCYGPMYHGGSYYSNTYLYSNANYFTGYIPSGTQTSPGINFANFDMGMRIACNVAALNSNKIRGDANGDGMVDVGDLGILAANYGLTSGVSWAMGDFNNDGAVDVGDLGILAANYGYGASHADFASDYVKVFGETVMADDEDTPATNDSEDSVSESNTFCGSLGLSLVAGIFLIGLTLIKQDE